MQINIQKNLVEFTPDNDAETAKLEALWRLMVDCARFNKKMVPVGAYVPKDDNMARFAIEGVEGSDEYPAVYVEGDSTAVCYTCNKYAKLNPGDRIPPCCGKLMEVLD